MMESTLFGIIFGHQRWRILILRPSEYKVDNNSSAKVGGKNRHLLQTKRKELFTGRRKGRRWKVAKIPSSNIWTNCDGVRLKRGWARCNARLYVYDAASARFWLEENTIHQVPPAWACVPVIKQKPCHKYHYDNVIMVSFITRRFVAVSSQYAEKIKRINEGCMAAH